MDYIAVCPSSAGMFQAMEVRVTAESVKEAHAIAWSRIVGSRYVSRIYQWIDKNWIEVWHEGMPL